MSRPLSPDDRVTLADVARRAGVSPMTVSNVVNGTGRVADATRLRVQSAVADLGYVPNQAARNLAGASLSRVGLMYSGVESIFIDATLAAVAVIAAQRGIQLQIEAVDDASRSSAEAVATSLARSGAQGLLLLPPHAELLGTGPSLTLPAAAIATAVALPNVATVRVDNRAAARAITERLIAAGRQRIAVLAGPQHHSDGVARLEGVREALAGKQDLGDGLIVEGDFTFASGLIGARTLLDRSPQPDAIVAANDDMAAAVLWTAHQRGLSLPDDLAVTGFDDTMIATRVWPALTTIHQPIRDMAAAAIECLAQAVQAPAGDARPRDIILPFALIQRGSA